MSNKIAKVLKVTHTGSKNGYNFWEVELAGGDKGGISGKKPDCYVKEGELIEYIMESYSNGNPKINVVNKGDYVKGSVPTVSGTEHKLADQYGPSEQAPPHYNRNSPEVQTYIIRQSSLQRAIEMFELSGSKPNLNQLCGTAEILTKYVMTGEIPKSKQNHPVTGQPVQSQEEIDDLPF